MHRIDKETTGILVVAKTPELSTSLKRQFADRTVEKSYLAWVAGSFDEAEGWIDVPVGRDPRAPAAHGRPRRRSSAETEFRVLAREPGRTLLLVRPRTGRTHQIRVHFTYIGHPVLGDRLYGGPRGPRLLLHAWRLSIAHPATGERLTFEAPPPAAYPRNTYEVVPSRRAARK